MPNQVISGPAANPEPPLEGLSPPIHTGIADSGTEGQVDDPSQNPVYILPPELREPPPGEPDSALEEKVRGSAWVDGCAWVDKGQETLVL
jgi:hypothetical protein